MEPGTLGGQYLARRPVKRLLAVRSEVVCLAPVGSRQPVRLGRYGQSGPKIRQGLAHGLRCFGHLVVATGQQDYLPCLALAIRLPAALGGVIRSTFTSTNSVGQVTCAMAASPLR